jgi:sodium-dependent dicarboxylate transporter 2/3/5
LANGHVLTKAIVESPPGQDAQSAELAKQKLMLEKMYLFAIAYSANLGGTGVVTGTNPNLILFDKLNELNIDQDGKYTALTFATWMAYNVPTMLINTIIAGAYLVVVFFGLRGSQMKSGKKIGTDKESQSKVKKMLAQKYKDLGPMTFHEMGVSVLFFFVVMLWLFRDPRFVKGWAEYIPNVTVGDSTAAMLAVFLLFVVPKSLTCFSGGPTDALLDWKYVQDHLAWGVVLLMGGGFALSQASQESGLSEWIGQQLQSLEPLDERLILLIVMLGVAFVTEVASNTATANIIIPILLAMSKNLNLHPLYLTLPATITCSYAFMLPVATPPNAIVFGASGGRMQIFDMVKTGAFLNFSCVIILFLMNISYGNLIFGYSDYVYPNATDTTALPLAG